MNSSVFICGDSEIIASKTHSINVQRAEVTGRQEVEYSDYPIFQQNIPQWAAEDEEYITKSTVHEGSAITIGAVKILLVQDGSTFQVGTNQQIHLESRLQKIEETPLNITDTTE
ncbi:spore germination protein GerPE [Paenibacillus sp. GCM10028914]|uniref:spore germination protein GerPE n=1 Tax=Paenibacillus sp. GCM10028914 TaxID=3273416 RepID=UPI003610180B